MRQLKPNHFFNAKAVGEDCGDDNPYCLLCHSMKMYVVFRLRNGDDVAFAYKMSKSSGEATWVIDWGMGRIYYLLRHGYKSGGGGGGVAPGIGWFLHT